MSDYTLHVDESGNPIITKGDEDISITIPRLPSTEITKEQAEDISNEKL